MRSTTRLTADAAPPGRSAPLRQASYGQSLHSANSAYSGQSPSTRHAPPVAYQLSDAPAGQPVSAGSSRSASTAGPRSGGAEYLQYLQHDTQLPYGAPSPSAYAPHRQFSYDEAPTVRDPIAMYGRPPVEEQPVAPIRAPSVSNYRPARPRQ